jgi:hypothetical protein
LHTFTPKSLHGCTSPLPYYSYAILQSIKSLPGKCPHHDVCRRQAHRHVQTQTLKAAGETSDGNGVMKYRHTECMQGARLAARCIAHPAAWTASPSLQLDRQLPHSLPGVAARAAPHIALTRHSLLLSLTRPHGQYQLENASCWRCS